MDISVSKPEHICSGADWGALRILWRNLFK